jgi:hypothetical protein
MASSGDTILPKDEPTSPEHISAESHINMHPESFWESDDTPSVDDTDGDVSKRNHRTIASIYLQNTDGCRFCRGRAKWNVGSRRVHFVLQHGTET